MSAPALSAAEKRALWSVIRVPVFAGVALLVMLAAIVLLGAIVPGRTASFIEAGLTVCMVLTVLLFTMEVREQAPLLRFFAALGFCWFAILVGMTMLDYWTR